VRLGAPRRRRPRAPARAGPPRARPAARSAAGGSTRAIRARRRARRGCLPECRARGAPGCDSAGMPAAAARIATCDVGPPRAVAQARDRAAFERDHPRRAEGRRPRAPCRHRNARAASGCTPVSGPQHCPSSRALGGAFAHATKRDESSPQTASVRPPLAPPAPGEQPYFLRVMAPKAPRGRNLRTRPAAPRGTASSALGARKLLLLGHPLARACHLQCLAGASRTRSIARSTRRSTASPSPRSATATSGCSQRH
jgi:hypothetical protein